MALGSPRQSLNEFCWTMRAHAMHKKAIMLRIIGVGLAVIAVDSRPRLRVKLEKCLAPHMRSVNVRHEGGGCHI